MSKGPKVLFVDIETLPIEAYTWGIWEQNVGINQISKDWTVLSWAAKWQGSKKVMYDDVRREKNVRNDKNVLRGIWKLLDEADIVIWQNGKSFDHKKLRARFILNGMKPPSPYRQIDTKQVASKNFGFTSNKLEYLSSKLNEKTKKYKTRKYPGFEMWQECMNRNMSAFKEMEKYNKIDVLSLEELYDKLQAWDPTINFSLYRTEKEDMCNCGSRNIKKHGHAITSGGKYQRYQCSDCGSIMRDKTNLLSKEHRKNMKLRIG
jgi:hypothetical protein